MMTLPTRPRPFKVTQTASFSNFRFRVDLGLTSSSLLRSFRQPQ